MFRILSIDGGGIRGIIPAKILSLVEDELRRQDKSTDLSDYFDLICGTSTGGIIAIALGLGLSPKTILQLYTSHAGEIFPKRTLKGMIARVIGGKSLYERDRLAQLLEQTYSGAVDGTTTVRLGHSKTRLCIPTYDANKGAMHVFKTSHHPQLLRDYQIPAHMVALATASAPIYFDSYDFEYTPQDGGEKMYYYSNIDGGIMANNPTLIGYTEAVQSLNIPVGEVAILSLGTGDHLFRDIPRTMNAKSWFYRKKRILPLYDLISSAQADYTCNLMKFYQRGLGEGGQPQFVYERIQHNFEAEHVIAMDDSSRKSLLRLENIGQELYGDHSNTILTTFFGDVKDEFVPENKL